MFGIMAMMLSNRMFEVQPHLMCSAALTSGLTSTSSCPTSSPGVRGRARDTRSVMNLQQVNSRTQTTRVTQASGRVNTKPVLLQALYPAVCSCICCNLLPNKESSSQIAIYALARIYTEVQMLQLRLA